MPPEVDPIPADNSVIREMRQKIDSMASELKGLEELKAKAKEADDLKAKLTEIERAKLDEIDRLKVEKDELTGKVKESESLKSQLDQFNKSFESMYRSELAGVPDDQKSRAEKLSASGTWAERLEAIREVKELMPAAKLKAGTATNPTAPGPTQAFQEAPKPKEPKDWNTGFSLQDEMKKGQASTRTVTPLGSTENVG